MNGSDEIEKQVLKQAKRTVNWASLILLFGVVFTVQLTYFPHYFSSPNQNISAIDTNDVAPVLMGMDLDSNDIENGIHIPSGLIVDNGIDVVMRTCGACHSLDLVTQNRADRNGWKDIIVWMQETQGLWDLGVSEEVILTYLSKNYAPKDEGRRRNLVVDEWYLYSP